MGERPATRPWYTHGWNTATSLRLILTIVPRVPRWLVPPLAMVTTSICIAYMRDERRAAARNLRRILGVDGWRLWRAVWKLFYSFSRFMVSYCEVPRLTPEELRARLGADPQGAERIREALSRGKGVIVLTAHLGNWEVGARALEFSGAQVNVAMQVERTNPGERWLTRSRERGSVRVVQVGQAPLGALALRAALARNEIVAMQGDRRTAGRAIVVRLFGKPFSFPVGPFLMAYECDAPLLPAFVVQEGWWRWRSEVGSALRFPRTADRDADLAAAADQYARTLERMVRNHPDQWFNFFDLWEAGA